MRYFDNTRIAEYKNCPRKFYFRHVRHWARPGVDSKLSFGSGWHSAMDVIWTGGSVDQAVKAFEQTFYEELGEPVALIEDFRNPATCRAMLEEYVDQRAAFFSMIETLAVEQPFAVPLADDSSLFYVGRMDKVFRHNGMGGKILAGEHKTTSWYQKEGNFRSAWIASFNPNSQVDGYMYAGHLLYGEAFKGVWVDGALVHKTVHDAFKFIPCDRQFNTLDLWLWETRARIKSILNDINSRSTLDGSESFLNAFPRNTDYCMAYNRACTFGPLCRFYPNPDVLTETPDGYIKSKWQPFDELKLSKIGLKEDEDA